MRIAFVLAGLHHYDRGAEIAFLEVARALARAGDEVTLFGAGRKREGEPYTFVSSRMITRERFEKFPSLPVLRSEMSYEEASFLPGFFAKYRPRAFDVTVTCSFPFTNWALRRPGFGSRRPPTIFVTQNGDWPAISNDSEFRFFACEGLVCTNPDYLERNAGRWRCALIPNGIDLARFSGGVPERGRFNIAEGPPTILMVSALMDTKRVEDGIKAVALLPDAQLVVAGDGPLREQVRALAAALLPGRFTQLTTTPDQMPALYRSADVFLHMSKVESFGNVFLEAMACGLPVVAHDVPRYRWIVGDEEHLTDTDQPTSVRDALTAALATAGRDNPGRRDHLQQFAWTNIAARYRSFFADVIAADKVRCA